MGGGNNIELESLVISLLTDVTNFEKMLKKAEADLLSSAAKIERVAGQLSGAANRSMAEAARLIASVATDQEKYAARIKKIDELRKAELLTQTQHDRLAAKYLGMMPAVIQAKKNDADATARATKIIQQSLNPYQEYGQRLNEIKQLNNQGRMSAAQSFAAEDAALRLMQKKIQMSPQYIAQIKQTRQAQKDAAAQQKFSNDLQWRALGPVGQHQAALRALNTMYNQGRMSQGTYNALVEQAFNRHPAIIASRKQQADMQKRVNQLTEQAQTPLQRYNSRVAELRTLQSQAGLSAEVFHRQMGLARQELNGMGQSVIPNLTRGLQGLGVQLRMVGGILSATLTAPIAGGIAFALNEFLKFDKGITDTLAIMNNVGNNTRRVLENAVLGMTKTSIFAPDALAKGLYNIAAAGYEAADALNALKVSEKFAIAGGLELDKASITLARAQSVLGLRTNNVAQNMTNMTRISDVMAKAADNSIATIDGLSKSLTNKAGASLRRLGKDITEGVAALAVLANQGVEAENAGQSLALVLRDLEKASQRQPKAWKEMGLSVYNSQGQVKNLSELIGDLEGKLGGMSHEQQRATLTMLDFQDKSLFAIQGLLGFSGAMKDYEQSLKDADGWTEKVAEKRLGSFIYQLTMTWNWIKKVAVELGQRLSPYLKMVNDYVRQGLTWWEALNQQSKDAIIMWAMIAAVLGPVVVAFGALAGIVAALIPLIAAIVSVGAPMIGTIAAIAAGIAASVLQFGLLAASIELTIQYFTGGSGLAAAWMYVVNQVSGWSKSVVGFFANLQENVATLSKWLTNLWDNAGMVVANFLATLVGNWLRGWRLLGRLAAASLAYIVGMISDLPRTIPYYFDMAWKGVIKGAIKMGEGIAKIIKGMLTGQTFSFEELGVTFGEDIMKGFEGQDMAATFGNIIKEEFGAQNGAMASVFGLDQLSKDLKLSYDAGTQIGDAHAEGITNAMQKSMQGFRDLDDMGMGGAGGGLTEVSKSVSELTDKLYEQGATLHMTSREAELWKLAQQGASADQLRQVDVLGKYVEQLTRAKEIMEKNKTPVQKFKEQEAELLDLLENGFLTVELYNKEWESLYKELEKDSQKEIDIKFSTTGLEAIKQDSLEGMAHLQGLSNMIVSQDKKKMELANALDASKQGMDVDRGPQLLAKQENRRMDMSDQIAKNMQAMYAEMKEMNGREKNQEYVVMKPAGF